MVALNSEDNMQREVSCLLIETNIEEQYKVDYYVVYIYAIATLPGYIPTINSDGQDRNAGNFGINYASLAFNVSTVCNRFFLI